MCMLCVASGQITGILIVHNLLWICAISAHVYVAISMKLTLLQIVYDILDRQPVYLYQTNVLSMSVGYTAKEWWWLWIWSARSQPCLHLQSWTRSAYPSHSSIMSRVMWSSKDDIMMMSWISICDDVIVLSQVSQLNRQTYKWEMWFWRWTKQMWEEQMLNLCKALFCKVFFTLSLFLSVCLSLSISLSLSLSVSLCLSVSLSLSHFLSLNHSPSFLFLLPSTAKEVTLFN